MGFIMIIINQRIKQLRIQNNLTQNQLADIIDVRSESVQRFEYGTRRPGLDILVNLADYFDVSLDYLVGRSDIKERQ